MTRTRIAILAAAVLLLGGGFFLWRETGFGGTAASSFSGYVEADYVMIASTLGGTLTTLDVARGDPVVAGARR